jgi:hypothetical protein
MELNVRIAIPQLVDNKQVYEEIPSVLVLSPQSKLKFLYVVFLLKSFSKTFCNSSLFNEFVCELGLFSHKWAIFKRE